MLRTWMGTLMCLFLTTVCGSLLYGASPTVVQNGDQLKYSTYLEMQRATSILSLFQGGNTGSCEKPVPFCPAFLGKLIDDDKEDGNLVDFNFLWVPNWRVKFAPILDSRYPSCARLMDPKFMRGTGFSSSQQMQKFAENTRFSEMGNFANSAIRACTSNSDAGDQTKVSKFYYASQRLANGMMIAQSEIAKIDSMLGGKKSLGKCESVFENVARQCQMLSSCQAPDKALDQIVAQSEIDEPAYRKNLTELKTSEDQCKTKVKKLEVCSSVITPVGLVSTGCQTPDSPELKKIQEDCQNTQGSLISDIALYEKVNPWFSDSGFLKARNKGQGSKDLIKETLQKTRQTLSEARADLEKSSQCLTGAKTDCDISDFRESLATTPWLPSQTSRGPAQSLLSSMDAQQCIEEGSMDRDNTGHTLRLAGRDALLTIGTMGVGGVVLKGAQFAGKGIEAATLAKSASSLAAVGVDLLFFGESAAISVKNCLVEFDKQKITLQNLNSQGPSCPDPLGDKIASERARESCLRSLADTILNSAPFLPALARTVRERHALQENSGWVDHLKRSETPTARKTPESPRPPERQVLISENLNREFTTVRQNKEWMELAANGKPDGKTRFFEVENSVMKELNDVTQDKNFVTALTNKHKSMMQAKIDALAKKYPGVEIVPYSDFKALRFALKPKPPATKLPASLEADLAKALKEANDEFTLYMKSNNLLRAGDKPEEWFRAGFGETADQATQASRYSRGMPGTNRMRSFSESDLHAHMTESLKGAEMYRSELQRNMGASGLMDAIPGGQKMTLKSEVFDAIRKTDSVDELKDVIKRSTGVSLTDIQAGQMRDYANLVDDFSPGIHIAERKIASLADSTNGGLSLDFAGMGSLNSRATAESLAQSENLTQAVLQTRNGERGVTEAFRRKKEEVRSSIEEILKRNGISAKIIDSGDDMVVKPSKPIPERVRREIAETLATRVPPSSIRVSHVPPGVVNESDRALIGTHGETIEKLMRKKLLGELPKEKLDQVLLMVDMRSTQAGNGSASLLLSAPKSPLTSPEKAKIQKAFQEAVDQLNEALRAEKQPGNYRPMGQNLRPKPDKLEFEQFWNIPFENLSQAGIPAAKYYQFSFNF